MCVGSGPFGPRRPKKMDDEPRRQIRTALIALDGRGGEGERCRLPKADELLLRGERAADARPVAVQRFEEPHRPEKIEAKRIGGQLAF